MSNDKLAQAVRELLDAMPSAAQEGADMMAVINRLKCAKDGARQALAEHEAEKQATLTIEAPNGDKIVAHGSAVDMMTLERIVKAKAEKQAGPVAAEWVGISLSERLDNLMHAARWDKDEVPFLKANLIRDIQRCAPPSESDKEDAERYRAIKASLYAENIPIGEAYLTLRVVGVCPDVGEWDAAIDAIRAARAKKEQQ